jgi:hypothetical protein
MLGLFKKKALSRVERDTSRDVFDVGTHLERRDGIPVFSETAWKASLADLPDDATDETIAGRLTAAGRSWLAALNAEAFDGRLQSGESRHFALLGDVAPERGKLILSFAETTFASFKRDLAGIVEFGPASKLPMLVFSEQDDYYRYVSAYFPEGHYGLSSGMFLSHGLGHFVFPAEEMWMLEPVIAHELFHATVKHLPLPAWLNEGLASNAEFRYGNRFRDPRSANENLPHHRRYWDREKLQRFWAGFSFYNADDGQELSYDLARRLVLGLSPDWDTARAFILQSHLNDAGESAANEILGYSLATAAEAITGVANVVPDPSTWVDSPFGGGYT